MMTGKSALLLQLFAAQSTAPDIIVATKEPPLAAATKVHTFECARIRVAIETKQVSRSGEHVDILIMGRSVKLDTDLRQRLSRRGAVYRYAPLCSSDGTGLTLIYYVAELVSGLESYKVGRVKVSLEPAIDLEYEATSKRETFWFR